MQRAKYTSEFKEEAVRQVIDKGYPVVDVANRLGIGDQILYKCVKKLKYTNQPVAINDIKSMQADLNRLKAVDRRTKEERDIPTKVAAYCDKHSEQSTRLFWSIEQSSL